MSTDARQLQLYMYGGIREQFLEQHDFYVAEVKARVFGQFADIEGEARSYRDHEYARLHSLPHDGDVDADELAQIADERAQDRYSLLYDLKKQMTLGALASMYHHSLAPQCVPESPQGSS
jgi:hypothetical protein